ncbi:MAG: CBS domain-containing protein [Candidatus Zapsychrus exili]|nr:CBS domain-containing protein [Candidatus Zapsychrus exili]
MTEKHTGITQLKALFERSKIENMMEINVVTIRVSEDFSVAQIKFMNNKINHLVVVDSAKNVVGILSRKYLYKAQSPRKIMQEEMENQPGILIDGDSFYEKDTLDSYILANIMYRTPFTLKSTDSIAEVIVNMSKKHIAFIPVVNEEGKVVGSITDQEIVGFIAKVLMM